MQNLIFMMSLVVGSILAICVGALVIVAVIYIKTTRSNQRELQRVIQEVIRPGQLVERHETREYSQSVVDELHLLRSHVDRVVGELQAGMDNRAIHAVQPAWDWMTAEAALAAFLRAWDDFKAVDKDTPVEAMQLRLQAISEAVYGKMLTDEHANDEYAILRRKLMRLASMTDRSVVEFDILGDSVAEDVRRLQIKPDDSQTISQSNDFIQRVRALVARS